MLLPASESDHWITRSRTSQLASLAAGGQPAVRD